MVNFGPNHLATPLHQDTTGPSSFRLCRAASFAACSSALFFSIVSQRLRLLAFFFSTFSASASRSACVISGGMSFSRSALFFFSLSTTFACCSSSSLTFARITSVLATVCGLNDILLGPSVSFKDQDSRSFFLDNFGVDAVVCFAEIEGSNLAFFRTPAVVVSASFALRFLVLSAFSLFCSSCSPSRSSLPAAFGP